MSCDNFNKPVKKQPSLDSVFIPILADIKLLKRLLKRQMKGVIYESM